MTDRIWELTVFRGLRRMFEQGDRRVFYVPEFHHGFGNDGVPAMLTRIRQIVAGYPVELSAEACLVGQSP